MDDGTSLTFTTDEYHGGAGVINLFELHVAQGAGHHMAAAR